MNEESRLESGANLARDLRRIRESRNISVDELNIQTKIPRTLLVSFEEHVLFDHAQFNRVYLRSFVRTYASTVGVSADMAVDALEAAADGRYDGRLAREYLGEDVNYLPPEMHAESSSAATEAEQIVPQDPVVEPTPVGVQVEVEDTAWAATSPPSRQPPPEKKTSRGAGSKPKGGGAGGWIGVVFGVIVVAGIVWGLVTVFGGGPSIADEVVAPVDTQQVVASEPEPARPQVTLDESIVFYVVAENGPVDPIRVTVDDDLRRPYWVDEGDSMRFVATDRIVFEEMLDVIRLNLQGYEYPTSRRDDQGRIVVTREAAQQFFDGL